MRSRIAFGVKRRLNTARLAGLTAFVFLISLVEAPIFLARNRRLFGNRTVYVFWHWSFGHTVTGLDHAARLYWPHRMSLVYVPHPRSNPVVPRCFEHSFDLFEYRSVIAPKSGQTDAPKYRVLRLLLLVLSGLTGRFEVVERDTVYRTLSVAPGQIVFGDEVSGTVRQTTNYTGYLRVLRDEIGQPPKLPSALDLLCREALDEAHADFLERPFVTLLLRRKDEHGPVDTRIRSAGPHENYVPVVEALVAAGYNVAGTGETEHDRFRAIEGYFALDGAVGGLSPGLLNVFLLTSCALFVGQQSGPLALPDACGIPCLITDALPHRLGTFRRDDLILFKHLRVAATGRELSLVEIFRERLDVGYGFRYDECGIVIEPCIPDELQDAALEAIALAEGRLELTADDLRLWQLFRQSIPPDMALAYQGNRPPLFVLRGLRDELLEGHSSAGVAGGTAESR